MSGMTRKEKVFKLYCQLVAAEYNAYELNRLIASSAGFLYDEVNLRCMNSAKEMVDRFEDSYK